MKRNKRDKMKKVKSGSKDPGGGVYEITFRLSGNDVDAVTAFGAMHGIGFEDCFNGFLRTAIGTCYEVVSSGKCGCPHCQAAREFGIQ